MNRIYNSGSKTRTINITPEKTIKQASTVEAYALTTEAITSTKNETNSSNNEYIRK